MAGEGAGGGGAGAPSDEGAPEKGSSNLSAPRFPRGKSGNPGGRPKSLPRFRRRVRDVSFALLERVRDRLRNPNAHTTAELVDMLVRLAPFGGFLPADEQAASEIALLRLALSLLDRSDLKPEQKRALLAQVRGAGNDQDGGQPGT